MKTTPPRIPRRRDRWRTWYARNRHKIAVIVEIIMWSTIGAGVMYLILKAIFGQ